MPSTAVLGLDFGGSKVALAVADPDGTRLGTRTFAVRTDDTAQQTFDRAVAGAHELLAEVAAGRTLSSVGACTFGIPRHDGIDLAPNIAGWERLAFGDRLRLAFPDAVLIRESGLATPEDARAAFAQGFDAVLIGEALMRSDDPVAFLRACGT